MQFSHCYSEKIEDGVLPVQIHLPPDIALEARHCHPGTVKDFVMNDREASQDTRVHQRHLVVLEIHLHAEDSAAMGGLQTTLDEGTEVHHCHPLIVKENPHAEDSVIGAHQDTTDEDTEVRHPHADVTARRNLHTEDYITDENVAW